MRDSIKAKIIALIRKTIDDESLVIVEETNLVNELELSSLEILSLLGRLEVEYNTEISDSVLRRMTTVGSMINVVMEQLGGSMR